MHKSLSKFGTYYFCSIVLLTLAACSQETPPPESIPVIGEMPATELYTRIENNTAPLILDVRSADEFAAGHLAGALNIAHSEFVDAPEASLALLPTAKDAEIVVHCVSGKRAGIAAEIIAGAGYTNVNHLSGDYRGWEAAGYPVEIE
jgi:phage shock protein E